MANRPELEISSGELAGRRVQVPELGLRVGRASSNDLPIPDEELSRNHCLFETEGDAIKVIDLASANGTFVNGEQLGSDPRVLAIGDTIEIGSTLISVVGDPVVVKAMPHSSVRMPASVSPSARLAPIAQPTAAPVAPAPAGSVDLGLGEAAGAAGGAAPQASSATSHRKPLANLLWAVAAVVVAAAIGIVLCMPSESAADRDNSVRSIRKVEEKPRLVSLSYEKIEATDSRIFRYEMTIDETGVLRVVLDDVPGENRHLDKSAKLSAQALERVEQIVTAQGFAELDESYSGSSAFDENALKSFVIRFVRGNSVRRVSVENTLEPEDFAVVREALEAFSKNELGIWAIQYSREKLIELSASSEKIGDAKWSEREVEYGNLSAALRAFREAVFYLDTVNPKPENYGELKEKMARAEAELAERYREQRFTADRAINLGDWDAAKTELRILCDLVPDKDDPRHAEANAKLVDVENRMKKKGAKRK